MSYRKISVLLLFLFAAFALGAQNLTREQYIKKYKDIAIRQMYRHNIPASIILAQACLESSDGNSTLAKKANNHFGIKCHDGWKGKKIRHDDDARNECFRKYKKVEDSFNDHSNFLCSRTRYASLFDLPLTDYKAWAHGLKKAGYATDPAYPSKLIKLIEDYRLYDYDTKRKSHARSARKTEALPKSPNEIEQVEAMTHEQRQDFHFSVAREVYTRNGVPFVRTSEGDTYADIAAANNLFLKELLRFNDLDKDFQDGT